MLNIIFIITKFFCATDDRISEQLKIQYSLMHNYFYIHSSHFDNISSDNPLNRIDVDANDASLTSVYFYTCYWLTFDYFASVFNNTYDLQSYYHWFECKMTIQLCAWSTCKIYSKYKHNDHKQGATFYSFPRSVMEDKITLRPSNIGSGLTHVVIQIISWIWEWLSKISLSKETIITGSVLRWLWTYSFHTCRAYARTELVLAW